MTEKLRILIAEDEAPARGTIRSLVETVEDVTCVGEAWGRGAVDEILELRPDVVFLDVRMPGMTGFEVLRALEEELGEEMPVVVVVTAHEEHALEAFDVRAVDYLLKPFTDERFHEALERALDTARLRRRAPRAASRVRSGDPAPTPMKRLLLDDGGATHVVAVDTIGWIEASGPYVVVHADDDHMVRRSLTSFEEQLAEADFFRVHRSALVNLARVRSILPLSHGDAVVVLEDGTRVRVSRGRREAFEAVLRGQP